MKKKNSKKKLPRYDIGRPIARGYQRNMGIGAASFNSQQGQSIMPEVYAMRQSQIPNAIGRLGQNAQYPLQALQNTISIPATTISTTLAPTFSPITASTAASITPTSTLSNQLASMTGGKLLTGAGMQQVGTNMASQTGKTVSTNIAGKTALNTAGKVAAGIGTAYGAYNVMNDIMHAGDTITTGQIANSRGTNTITTAGGNTYTEKTGADSAAAMEYEKQAATAKNVGLTMDALGLGASIGSFFGPLGTGIGAAGGALIGGLASLFGFGDNEEEVQRRIDLINDTTALENRQSEGLAKNQDTRDAFYGNAANGKMPGFRNGKANARVSNGEVIGNFEDGYFRVPGGKNNKDTIKTHLGKEDFVISNKHGLSDYAWLTGDIPGALAAQSYLQKTGQMNKYKNGRLPKYEGGRWSDAIFSMIPHGISAAQNLTQLLRAQNADIYAPDFYVENPEGAKAVNTLASLRFDADPYYREAQRGLNQANWDARRLVSLGTGGRAIMQNANYAQYLNGLKDITKMYNEANNAYAEKYATALAQLGATNQGRRMEANNSRYRFLQQANAARENWMAQYRKNIDQNLLNAASEYMKWGQYNDALGIQNKMLNLYDRQITNEENKVRNGLPDTRVQVSNTAPVSTYVPQMIARPSDDDILQRVFATAPWRQKQQSRPKSVDPYTNIYNLAPWH